MCKEVLTLVVIAAAGAAAQTQIDLRTQAKNVDFGSAPWTRPLQTGTALPATCAVGYLFFKTDAPAGSNIYGCAAANTWTVQSGGGSGNMSTNVQNVMTRGQIINGTQDEVQLDIIGNVTQTNPVFRVRTSSGANLIQANSDGSVNIGSGLGPEINGEQTAPNGSPATGTEWIWSDSTAGFTRGKNAAGTIFQMSKEMTGIRYANGAATADSAATAANITSLFSGCSGTMYLGADGMCHTASGAGTNVFSFSTLFGRDDFCGNSADSASGGFGTFTSKMVYVNLGGGTIGNSQTSCKLTLTTAATAGASSSVGLHQGFTIIPATQATQLEVVFSTSDATNASFSFAASSDNGVIRGSSNGIAIQALAGAATITLETCSGFSCTSTSSGVAYQANTVYKATMSTDGMGNGCIQVNSGATVCTNSNVSATLSPDTGLVFGVKTISATAVTATVLGWAYSIPGY